MAKKNFIIGMLMLVLGILALLFLLNFLIFTFIFPPDRPIIYEKVYEETWDNELDGSQRPWTKQNNVAFKSNCLDGKCAELYMAHDCKSGNPHSTVETDISDLNLTLTNQTRFYIEFNKPRTFLCSIQSIGRLDVEGYLLINNKKVYLWEPQWSFTGDSFQRGQPNVCTLSDLSPFMNEKWNYYEFTMQQLMESNEACVQTFSDQINNNIDTLHLSFFARSDSRANLLIDTVQIWQ